MRRLGLDVLKGAAVLFVVFNHALVWPMRSGDLPSAFFYGIAFWTVASFTAVAGWVRGLRAHDVGGLPLSRRARQILLPWAIWAPLYASAPLLWNAIGGGDLPINFEPVRWIVSVALGGGPLWYLPVLFVAQAVCERWVDRHDGWGPAIVSVGAYAALATVTSLFNESPLGLGRGTFWTVAPLYIAAYWFGVRVARGYGSGVRGRTLTVVVVVSTLLSGFVTLLRNTLERQYWLMWLPYALGLAGGCALLVLALREAEARAVFGSHGARLAPLLARAGRVSLGVYVLHPAFLGPAEVLLHGRAGVPGAVAVAVATVTAATVLAEHAKRVPFLRHAL